MFAIIHVVSIFLCIFSVFFLVRSPAHDPYAGPVALVSGITAFATYFHLQREIAADVAARIA